MEGCGGRVVVQCTSSPRGLKYEALNCPTDGDVLALLSNICTARNMKPGEGRVCC